MRNAPPRKNHSTLRGLFPGPNRAPRRKPAALGKPISVNQGKIDHDKEETRRTRRITRTGTISVRLTNAPMIFTAGWAPQRENFRKKEAPDLALWKCDTMHSSPEWNST